jgi:hypothetical protein
MGTAEGSGDAIFKAEPKIANLVKNRGAERAITISLS